MRPDIIKMVSGNSYRLDEYKSYILTAVGTGFTALLEGQVQENLEAAPLVSEWITLANITTNAPVTRAVETPFIRVTVTGGTATFHLQKVERIVRPDITKIVSAKSYRLDGYDVYILSAVGGVFTATLEGLVQENLEGVVSAAEWITLANISSGLPVTRVTETPIIRVNITSGTPTLHLQKIARALVERFTDANLVRVEVTSLEVQNPIGRGTDFTYTTLALMNAATPANGVFAYVLESKEYFQRVTGVWVRVPTANPVITARQPFGLRQRVNTLNVAVPGMFVGNSIVNIGWVTTLLGKLGTVTGLGLSAWQTAAPNYAVGGAQVSQAAFLLAAQAVNTTYTDARGWAAQVNPLLIGKKFVVIGGQRNETPDIATAGFLKSFRLLLEGMVDAAQGNGMDVILVTDFQQVDISTGAQSTLSVNGDPAFVEIYREVAAVKGCTLVDEYQYSVNLRAIGGIDLRTYLLDGTHPADGLSGTVNYREIIAQHVYDAIMTAPIQESAPRPSTLNAGMLITSWATLATTPEIHATVTTQYSKKVVTGFGTVRTVANAGGTFALSPFAGYIWSNVLLLANVSGSESFTISGVTATSQSAGAGVGSTNHREQTKLIYNNSPYSAVNPTPNFVNNSAQTLELVGLLLSAPMTPGQTSPRVATAITSSGGTWTDTTNATDGAGVSGPDVDGAYIDYEFWGTGCGIRIQGSATAPIYDLYVDGVLQTSGIDGYRASAVVLTRGTVNGLEYGRHVLRLQVNGRNASSVGVRDIRFWGFIQFDARGLPDAWTFVLGDRGLTAGTEPNAYYVPYRFTDTIITRTLTGTPVLVLNRLTGRIEVTGGTALVRVIR